MKRFISIILILMVLVSPLACGDTKVIDGVEYDTYGLLNKEDKKNPNIKYDLIVGNLIWGCILVETIIAPVYFFGFSLFEPVGKIGPNDIKGSV